MELKIVSFEVAKALKEAGYPQEGNCDKYATEQCKGRYIFYTQNPDCTSKYDDNDLYDFEVGEYIDHEMYSVSVAHSAVAPTYIEVWLWLWREKGIRFDVEDLWDAEFSYPERGCASNTNQLGGICTPEVSDPEEAIIAAIEYLVDNNLIK